MAKLPQDVDYGGRPSLRSNRVDRPNDGTIVPEAIERATQNVAQIYGQTKAQEDRLNYNLAKQELLKADLEERQALQDDEDWATYDDRYREKFGARRDEIFVSRDLSPASNALLSAETDLMTERGSVNVQAAAKVTELDEKRSTIDGMLDAVSEQVQNADPQASNELLLNAIDMLRSAEAEGIYDDEEVTEKIQRTVTDISTARLDSMPAERRVAELKLSLAGRDARGPITQDDVRAGKGTGSIADFLHRDVVTKMLEKAEDEDRVSTIQAEAFDIIDEVTDMIPGTSAANFAEQKKTAREMLDRSDPEYGAKRNFLEQELAQRQRESTALVKQFDDENELGLVNMLDAGTSLGSLPAGIWTALPEARRAALKRYAQNVAENNGFAIASTPETLNDWYGLTREQKMDTDLLGIDWKNGMDKQDWERALREQTAYRDAAVTQKDPNIYRGDPDDEVLRNMLVGQNKLFKRIPAVGTDDYEQYTRIDAEVNRRLVDASLKKYDESGSGYMLPQEVHDITAQTLNELVYLREWGRDPQRVLSGLSEEERTGGDVYVKEIDDIRLESGGVNSQGQDQTMEDYLRNIAGPNADDLSDNDIESAYFLWRSGDIDGAERLLMGRD